MSLRVGRSFLVRLRAAFGVEAIHMVDMTGFLVGAGGTTVVAIESARPAIVSSLPIRIGSSDPSSGLPSSGSFGIGGG